MPAGSTMALNFFRASTEAASRFMICLRRFAEGPREEGPGVHERLDGARGEPPHDRRLGLVGRVVEEVELHVEVGALHDGLQVDAHLAGRVAGRFGGCRS